MTVWNAFPLSVLLFLWPLVGNCQIIPHQQFGLDDGLPDQECYDIVQDSLGYVWLGTSSGLVRFDGREFRSFSIPQAPSCEVFRLKMLGSKLLLLTSSHGFFVYEKDSIFQPPAFKSLHDELTKRQWRISTLANNDSLGITLGLVLQNGTNLQYVSISRECNVKFIKRNDLQGESSMLQFLKNGDRVISCFSDLSYETRVRVFQDHKSFHIPLIQPRQAIFSRITNATSNSKGTLVYAVGNLLIVFHNGEIHRFPFNNQLVSGALCFENDSTLWMGFRKSNAVRATLHLRENGVKISRVEVGIQDASRFYFAQHGEVFVTSVSQGFSHIPSVAITKVNDEDVVTDIAKHNNELVWLNNEGELVNYPGGKILGTINGHGEQLLGLKRRLVVLSTTRDKTRQEEGILYTSWHGATSGLETDSHLVMCSRHSFAQIDENNEINVRFFEKSKYVVPIDLHSCFILRRGKLLVYNFKSEITSEKVLPWGAAIHSLQRTSNGNFYCADQEGQLLQLDKSGELTVKSKKSFIYSRPFIKVDEDKENLIILFKSMILSVNKEEPSKIEWYVPRYPRLFSGNFKSFAFVGKELFLQDHGAVYNLSIPLVGGTSNLSYTPVIKQSLDTRGKVELGYNDNSIELINSNFNFSKDPFVSSVLSVSHNQKVNFLNASESKMHLLDLASGNYEIGLHTFNSITNAKTKTKSLHISVAHPVWERWWFYPGVVLLFLIPILVGFVFYFQSKIKSQVLRNKLNALRSKAINAQLKPHFTFNALSSIQYLMNTGKIDEADRYLSRFGKLLRLVLHYVDKQWYSFSVEEAILEHYISLENLRFKKSVRVTFQNNTDYGFDEIQIPPMLLQVLVENSFHHGLATVEHEGEVAIQVSQLDQKQLIKVRVLDNGVGFQAIKAGRSQAEPDDSHGLGMLKKRLELISKYEKKHCELSYGACDATSKYASFAELVLPIKKKHSP